MTHSKNDNELQTEAMGDSRPQDQALAIANEPPDWSMVPFSVACPRCGCDVHGRSDAVCPDCDLKLDWSILAPVEELACPACKYKLYGLTVQRCPECGREFDWNKVVDDYRRRQKPLFEFQWRQAPVRWLLRAIWLSFRPWVLWRRIDIYDPTPKTGLALLGGLTLLASVAVPLLLVSPIRRFFVWHVTSGLPQYRWLPSWPYAPWVIEWWLPTVIRASAIASVVLVAWFLAALGGLLVLRNSMFQCRVRNGHVFRVCVHSFLPVACYPAIAYALSAGAATSLGLLSIIGNATGFTDVIGAILTFWRHGYGDPLLALALLALSTASMALGYRRYIQMRHSWAVALAGNAMAFLMALIVLIWLNRNF